MSIISLEYDLSDIDENKFIRIPADGQGLPYLYAQFKLHIKVDARIDFWMTFGEETMGSVDAEYE